MQFIILRAVSYTHLVISGKGLFYGKIRKDFTIQKTGEESHIHEVVIDEAVAATCTRDGVTEGSHCSKCGEVLEEQTVIPAMGHQYAGGTCERCGDILYIDVYKRQRFIRLRETAC